MGLGDHLYNTIPTTGLLLVPTTSDELDCHVTALLPLVALIMPPRNWAIITYGDVLEKGRSSSTGLDR